MTYLKHKEDSPKTLRFAILTVTDSRTIETDESGRMAEELLAANHHEIYRRLLLPNDPDKIRESVEGLLRDDDIDVIMTIGGTGLSKKDVTVDVISKLVEKKIDGFGELFRLLSYRSIGKSAMLSRAFAGVAKWKVVVCLPGSIDAVELAVKELILPEIGHMVRETRR